MVGDQVRVTEGKEQGKILSVDVDLLIGRHAPEDEGRLGDDPEISRHHARVSRGADGRLAIEDLGSANGTYVNGERIDAPQTLEHGDLIRVGKTVLEVTDGSGVPAAEPAPSEPPGAAVAAGAVLVVTAGNAIGRQLDLADELVIGRRAEGDGRLGDDPRLSRRHARVTRSASGEVTIEDLGSANGTFVNGERVRDRRVLTVGDVVRIGSTIMELAAPEVAPRIAGSAGGAANRWLSRRARTACCAGRCVPAAPPSCPATASRGPWFGASAGVGFRRMQGPGRDQPRRHGHRLPRRGTGAAAPGRPQADPA